MENLMINLNFKKEEFKEKYFNFIDTSIKTRQTYLDGIKSFYDYLVENEIKNPTRDNVITWRDELRENHSSSTVNTYLVSVKSFFAFLSMCKLYPNITENVKGAKVSTTAKKSILTLNQTQHIYKTLTDKREKALFGLLVTTGLRGIEVVNAKIEDIRKFNNEMCLFIKCKGHSEKDEYVKLADNVYQDILNYIGDRKQGYIFISTSNHNSNGGLTTKTLRLIIKNIYKRYGLEDENMSLHSTRRTAGCLAYNLGQNIYDIQQMLHHQNINTTKIYIRNAGRNNNDTELKIASAICG